MFSFCSLTARRLELIPRSLPEGKGRAATGSETSGPVGAELPSVLSDFLDGMADYSAYRRADTNLATHPDFGISERLLVERFLSVSRCLPSLGTGTSSSTLGLGLSITRRSGVECSRARQPGQSERTYTTIMYSVQLFLTIKTFFVTLLSMSHSAKKKGRPLNLREFPDDLYWLAKTCASLRHMSLKAYVVAALKAATDIDSKTFLKRKSGESDESGE